MAGLLRAVLCPCWPDIPVESEDPVPRHLVMGIVKKSSGRHEVLDVSGLEEPEAAILPIRDFPHCEFNFDQVTVMTGPHKHRLLAKLDSGHVGLKNSVDDRSRLGDLRRSSGSDWVWVPYLDRCEGEVLALPRVQDGYIRDVEDSLSRSEVSLELDGHGIWITTDQLAKVVRIGSTEPVDGLGFVAHDGETCAIRGQSLTMSTWRLLTSWYSSTST